MQKDMRLGLNNQYKNKLIKLKVQKVKKNIQTYKKSM